MLRENCHAFSQDDEVGCMTDVQMKINLSDTKPVQKRYNSIPRPLYPEVKAYVEDLINRNWIKKSESPYSSPMVVVRKNNGEMRLCCDFRELNSKTIPDRYPLPRIQSILDNLGGNKYYSILDQRKAYHQAFMDPSCSHLTAFVTPWGLYEWVRIPFGLMNAPATFQRAMERVLHGYTDKFVIPFLDDILIYSKNFKGHLEHVRNVLRRLIEHGIKLKADKCSLFQSELTFLGRKITEEGYRMGTKNLEALNKFKSEPPTTVGELRRLLGMLGHFRRFIKDYSKIARPLFNLLENEDLKKDVFVEEADQENPEKDVTKDKNRSSGQLPSKRKINFGEDHQLAVNQLIEMISSEPILAFPDFTEPFIVNTDASKNGLGAVLYQQRDSELRVIAFASRTLVNAEKSYHANKLEFLALKWAVTEAFHEYLLYAPKVSVFTDNNPLTYVMTTAKLNATGQCWVNDLANYNLEIKYRTGKTNQVADCLSRSPLETYKACTEIMTAEDLAALYDGIRTQRHHEEAWVALVHTQSDPVENPYTKSMTKEEIKDLQMRDEQIRPVLEAVIRKQRPKERDQENRL